VKERTSSREVAGVLKGDTMEMRQKVTSGLAVSWAIFKNLLGFVVLLLMLVLGNWTY
jgi:hypothetical protein